MSAIAMESITPDKLGELMPKPRLILSDEPQMETQAHYEQLALLESCLQWLWRERRGFFIGANLSIYFRHDQLRGYRFRGPDFFLVRDVDDRPRASWVVWDEGGRYPDLIVELLSPATAEMDRTVKKHTYETVFRTPEYFWFHPETLEFAGFGLVAGRYEEIPANESGWRWSQVLGLYLGVVDGRLRYITEAGEVVPTPHEAALRAMAAEEEARQRAEQERSRAEALAAKLRAMGVNPDEIGG